MLQLPFAWRRDFRSVLTVVWELLRDGLQFMNVVARSQTAVVAEVLSGWTVSNRRLDLQVIFSY
jgi:hypothetical protein